MKPLLQLHIPKPCHEDWNKMTPVDKGKFCRSCNKQVVDFSLMSDQQVLNYFSTATAKTCGRFAEDQLRRELIPTKIERKKTWWFAAIMPLLLLFEKTNAQKKSVTTNKVTTAIITQESREQIMGKVAAPVLKDTSILMGEPAVKERCTQLMGDTVFQMPKQEREIMLKGRITDATNGGVIPFATVAIKGEKTAVASDEEGNFILPFRAKETNVVLSISSVGFVNKEIEITISSDLSNNISLTPYINSLPETIVVNSALTTCSRMLSGDVVVVVGYINRHKPVKTVDTLKSTIRKAIRNEAFKAYPNPLPKDGTLHIEMKNAGNYSIQLLDNNSKLLLVQEFTAESNKAIAAINTPAKLAAGIYYLRVIDDRKKKSYVDKIIIE